MRLFGLIARVGPRAVIFRRGPSKRVQLVAWNTDTDEIERGQTFHGRVYERRSDLSPDGKLLLYFAGSYREPFRTWSAISEPPLWTALALWPKGDAWGGGGLFLARDRIALNHFGNQMKLAEGFALPRGLSVEPLEHANWGEDDPLWSERLRRDGWTCTSEGKARELSRSGRIWIQLDPPTTWVKAHAVAKHLALEMRLSGIKERNGPWYVVEHRLLSDGEPLLDLGRTEWADFTSSGDLVFTRGSALLRMPIVRGALKETRTIVDFAGEPQEERDGGDERPRS